MNAARRHFLAHQAPALIWAATIFVLSSIPGDRLPEIVFHVWDKLLHATVFFMLCLLLHRALRSQMRFPRLQLFALVSALFLTVLYGGIDEFHQHFVPGRRMDLLDLVADATGGLVYAVSVTGWKLFGKSRSPVVPS